ncbi:hypothetical protein AAULR_15564 [Lacticaseibacillus rhamnosus MTCC 5462]|nr:hypothetical protein AAULR_15564 [Lacticaseibacillus rhamnosus MTCC 5462]MDZ5418855.1 hypothetical protein [Lacticaseibacillus rhamnosus]
MKKNIVQATSLTDIKIGSNSCGSLDAAQINRKVKTEKAQEQVPRLALELFAL